MLVYSHFKERNLNDHDNNYIYNMHEIKKVTYN